MIHPDQIKVQVKNTHGLPHVGNLAAVIASLQVSTSVSVDPYHASPVLLQEAERCVSRRLWQLLYGDLDRALAELGELYFRHCIERGDYHDQQRFDDFHSKLTQLRVKLSFNQPPKNNICPPANQQQATHATFSETRTAQEKVTSPESQMSEPTQKISPKLWAEAGAYQHSEKSTESPLQNPSAPTSSSSTEKELE